MSAKRYISIVALVFSAAACRSTVQVQPEVIVAAAANLTEVLHALGPRFEAETGTRPIFSFASTAQLARQIENSAPFDVFAAADAQHVDDLDRKGFLLPGSRAIYATGVLALWIPAHSIAAPAVSRLQDLTRPEVHVIAMAKPELAPYGQAAVDTLKRAGLWDKVQARIVYAENISMAKQYGTSNNADAVFTAYSLVLRESGNIIQVDEKLHAPITQELGILAKSPHQEAARQFVMFLLTGAGRDVLRTYGYRIPATH
jgi:molybdate transport system substrate-binding protein